MANNYTYKHPSFIADVFINSLYGNAGFMDNMIRDEYAKDRQLLIDFRRLSEELKIQYRVHVTPLIAFLETLN